MEDGFKVVPDEIRGTLKKWSRPSQRIEALIEGETIFVDKVHPQNGSIVKALQARGLTKYRVRGGRRSFDGQTGRVYWLEEL